MNGEQFDDLTRALAKGISRRQALRLMASGLAGGLLALIGYKAQRNSYAAAGPQPEQQRKLYLPLMGKPCSVPSACGKRSYCSADQTCLCVKSAEGDIRCGKIPSTCAVKLCKTSADCASLGEGYFCDTPNSGCCTDPPAELPRCIAPCVPSCPPDRVCGANCCGANEVCINNVCVACPAERLCGTLCCPDGQECSNGQCQQLAGGACASDFVTGDSLAAARAALAAGANDVQLSPGGCVRYRRTVSNGLTLHEETTFKGARVMEWDHIGSQSMGKQDIDLDGFAEYQITVTRGPTADDFDTLIQFFAPITRQLERRETYSQTSANLHVRWEAVDASGTLDIIAEFDMPPIIVTSTMHNTPSASASCTPAQEAALKDRLHQAIGTGFECMRHFNATDILLGIMVNYVGREVVFECRPSSNVLKATLATSSYYDPLSPLKISIDNVVYFLGQSEYDQKSTLWHEMLHTDFGPHNPLWKELPRYNERDRVESCTRLCFGPDPVTKCMCANCLRSKKNCDKLCSIFDDCDGLYQCKCGKNKDKYYKACSMCLAECPSGLGCFTTEACEVIIPSTCPETCP